MDGFTGFSEKRRDGESVLEARPAWRSYCTHFIVIAAALALDIFRVEAAAFFLEYSGISISPTLLGLIHIVLLIIPTIAVLNIARHRFSRKYIIRNADRIISEHGYIGKHERSVPMNAVSIEVRQPFWGAVFSFGDLLFRPGTEQIECAWEGVISPRKLRKDIENFSRPENLSHAKDAQEPRTDPVATQPPKSSQPMTIWGVTLQEILGSLLWTPILGAIVGSVISVLWANEYTVIGTIALVITVFWALAGIALCVSIYKTSKGADNIFLAVGLIMGLSVLAAILLSDFGIFLASQM